MKFLLLTFQILVALGLVNVWLLRFNRSTSYRGGAARTMSEEFAVYGLPKFLLWIVGALKLGCAVALILGIWMSFLVKPAAAILAVLMVVAILMHLKVRDPLIKSLPALSVLTMVSVLLAYSMLG
jgi:hypothetical protein